MESSCSCQSHGDAADYRSTRSEDRVILIGMCIHRVYMAKRLYWRLKINGKWTWKPVKFTEKTPEQDVIDELIDYNQVIDPEVEE